MVIDTSPFADSFWNGYVVPLCHYSYEICELKIGAYPFDTGIRVFTSEKRKELIWGCIRSNPLGAEKILIESCDVFGIGVEPTISEGSIGHTMCGALA